MENPDREVWRVLHIDDDEDDYLLAREMLSEAQGREIVLEWAPNYGAGQRCLHSSRYDAVLVDYDLGPRTGIELIRETTSQGYRAPLILYTGRGSYDVDLEAMQAGATLYLTKAEANPLLLERSIRYAIERKRFEQERTDLIESIQDGFFAVDKDWRITYINRRAAQNAGFEPEELIGRNIWEVFPRLLGTQLEHNYRLVMEGRKSMKFETQGVYQGLWYSVSIYPFHEGISIYWQDITEKRKAEEAVQRSEAMHRAIARNLPDGGVVVVDRDMRFLVAEGSLWSRLGIAPEKLEGRTVREALDERTVQIAEERCRRSLAGETSSYETEHFGRVVWSQYLPLRDEHGQVIAAMVLALDITERKQVEEALRESVRQQREMAKLLEVDRGRLAAVLENLPVGVWIADQQGQLIGKNEQADRIWAGDAPLVESIEKYQQYTAWYADGGKLLLPEEYPVAKVLQTGQPVEPVELNIRRFDGTEGTVLVSAAPVKDREGLLAGVVGVNVDITGRKQAEEALREREEMLRLALTAGRAGAWSWDLSSSSVHWSDEYYRIFGFEPGSVQPSAGAGFSRIHPDDLPRIESIVREAAERGTPIDAVHRVIWPDGSVHWVRGISRAFHNEQGQPYRMAGIAIDMTEQKHAELQLQAAHRRTVEILESISDAFYSLDHQGRFTYVNQRAASLWGKQPGDLLGKIIWEVFPSGKETESYRKIQQALAGRQPIQYESYSAFLDQWVDIHLYPTEGGISVYFQDISQRKRAEEALKRKEIELTEAQRLAHLGSWVWDAKTDATTGSEELFRIYGLDPVMQSMPAFKEQKGRLYPAETWERLNAAVQKTVQTGVGYELDVDAFRNGDLIWITTRSEAIRDAGGRVVGLRGTVQDITERKQAEAALQLYMKELERSNRDLQEFAFVASHDLQEPLRKIEALGDLILEGSTNLTERQRDQLTRLRNSSGRMRNMVDGLLQLSRLSTHAQPFQPVDLRLIAQEVLSDLELQIKRTGGVVEVGDLPVIQADPLQMRQLLQNLIGNALKFQPPGGKPRVKVFFSQPTPESVQIQVQDNGIGFDEEHAPRLFQPFNRLVGRSEYEGSGIGLAISRKIVERHGGEITAYSKSGHGSTFIITLPLR